MRNENLQGRPRSISFEKRLPRTDAGKLYKQVLIDRYAADAR
jgi:acyl-coenzyme A synthetase/AMP-(fatty) acid ligase